MRTFSKRMAEPGSTTVNSTKDKAEKGGSSLSHSTKDDPFEPVSSVSISIEKKELDTKASGPEEKDLQRCGRYVAYLIVTYEFMLLSQTVNLLFMSFAGVKMKPENDCPKLNDGWTKKCDVKTGFCKMVNGSDSFPCNYTAHYDFGGYKEEFSNAGSYPMLFAIAPNIGLLFGAIAFGTAADRFGRKKILLLGTLCLMLSEGISLLANDAWTFTILRFFVMFFTGGKHSVSNPYIMENLPTKYRLRIVTLVTYSPNYIVLAAIAYFCKTWRVLTVVSVILTAIPMIMLLFVHESPKFFIKQGNEKMAVETALKIIKWERNVSPKCEEAIISSIRSATDNELAKKETGEMHPMKNLLRCPLSKYCSLLSLSLFTASFVSYGIAYNVDKIGGDIYVNVLIIGAARYAINIICVVAERKWISLGRVKIYVICMGSISAITLFALTLYFSFEDVIVEHKRNLLEGNPVHSFGSCLNFITQFASILAAAICTEIFVVNTIQSAELFPTAVRTSGNASIQVFNRLGTALSPLLFKFSASLPWTPFAAMFTLCALDAVLFKAFIPETRGKPLPDRMPWEVDQKRVE